MSWVDLGMLVLLVLSALIGGLRGFVRESLGLAAWVGAFLLATRLYPRALPLAHRLIAQDAIADPVAFTAVFVALLVVFLIVAAMLGSLVRGTLFRGLDRFAGLGFGLLRGAAALVAAYLVGVAVMPVADWPSTVQRSRLLPYIHDGAVVVAAWLPDRFRPDLGRPAIVPGDHVL